MSHSKALPPNAIEQIKSYLLQLQNTICAALETYRWNKSQFIEDNWQRPSWWRRYYAYS